TASHIQDCWETSTGARKTVTARVVPSTSTRAITAGTVTDRVRCAGEWDELMGRLCLSGRWGTEGRRAAAPGASVRASRDGPGRPHRAGSADQPIWEEISSPAEVIVEWGSAPPTMLACAMPSGPQMAAIAGMAGIGSAGSASSANWTSSGSSADSCSRSSRLTGGRGLASYIASATSVVAATSATNCWAKPALGAEDATYKELTPAKGAAGSPSSKPGIAETVKSMSESRTSASAHGPEIR